MKFVGIVFSLFALFCSNSYAQTRIKDIASFEGFRDNFLVGRGLVVGLNGTGDNLKNSVFTEKELVDLLEKLNMNVQGSDRDLKTRNVASVTVTAKLQAFARNGSKMDVKVATIGDATSLKGGLLLATTLLGADGRAYAAAQGPISIHEFNPSSDDVKTKPRNIETVGFVQNGAIVESEVDFDFSNMSKIKLSLYSPDFTTTNNVVDSINSSMVGNTASALDGGTILVSLPKNRRDDIVNFLAELEQIQVSADHKAKIVINSSTGTIVMGNNVKIRPVAIAQGNLVINVDNKVKDISSKLPLMNDNKQKSVSKGLDLRRGSGMQLVEQNSNLSDLVDGLNKLGVYPRDMIEIIYNMKNAGAVDAEIEVIN